MNIKEKRANKIGIIAGSIMLMSSLTISALLGDIAAVYPNVSRDKIQLILTIPNLIAMFCAFAAGPLTARFAKKNLLLCGMGLGLVGGFIAYFFGSMSLNILYLSSAFIGINQGLNGSLTKVLVPDFLEGQERADMMGYQAASSTAGSVFLTLVAGVLAGIFWKNSYIVFLMFIPAMIIVKRDLKYVPPTKKSEATGEKGKLNGAVFFTAATLFLAFLMLFTYQANVSMYIKSAGLGNVTTAGYANTIFVFAGMVAGFVFGKFRAKLDFKTMQVGIAICALGFLGIKVFGTLLAVFCASLGAGIAQGFIIPSAMIAVSAYAPESVRATGISITYGLLNFGMFLSPMVLNPIANTLVAGDLSSKFMIAGIGLLVLLVVHTALSPVFYKKQEQNKTQSA